MGYSQAGSYKARSHLICRELSEGTQELLQQEALPCRMACRTRQGSCKVLCGCNKVFCFGCMGSQLVLEVAVNVGPLLGLKDGHHLPADTSGGHFSLSLVAEGRSPCPKDTPTSIAPMALKVQLGSGGIQKFAIILVIVIDL